MTHRHDATTASPRRARLLVPAAPLAAVSLLLAACGSSSPQATGTTTSTPARAATTTSAASATGGSSTPTTPTTSPAASSTTATTATTSPAGAGIARCTTDHLALSLGSSSGSAGAVDVALVFTNTGSLACHLYGYPGVSAVSGPTGHQFGLAAGRATQLGPPTTVTLAPGQKANADLHVTEALNYPTSRCRPVTPAGFRVYPPGATTAGFVTTVLEVCSADVPGQLAVGPVVAGAHSSLNGATAGTSG